ncbi:MAG: low molecular weight phosphotyrosine protein phosphatase [Bacteroidales bacterium]|nr:low molecular weight phosphotyrosine protein phosphatase [Bacteroidales bacterium]
MIINKTSILFVCLGNICRSPAAESIMNDVVEKQQREREFIIDSCGIGAWHMGQKSDRRMIEAGEKRGYSFLHRARQIKKEDLLRFDYIIGMDDENISDILSLSNDEKQRRKVYKMASFLRNYPSQKTIPDPYYGGKEDFEFVLDLLEDAVLGLIDFIDKNKK